MNISGILPLKNGWHTLVCDILIENKQIIGQAMLSTWDNQQELFKKVSDKCPENKSIDNLPRITKIECQIAKHERWLNELAGKVCKLEQERQVK